MERHSYGPDPAQFGELYLPSAERALGTVVVIHGGFWRARYDCSLGRPLAADLAARGYVAWNLEYRRVSVGGGWPRTLDDVAAGIDHLADLGVDTARLVAIGHSAGGHLAVWAAGRSRPRVALTGVIAQAGVLDLVTAATTGVGHTAVLDLLGGRPDEVPDRYAAADPLGRVPVPPRVVCLHSAADDEVPIAQSRAYVAAAAAAGGDAVLIETAGDHYTMIDPSTPDWALALGAVAELLPSR
ncbi:prolyl oligopeptidase family serine peptidase [Jatrophihabitans cynanchi]|uniref:Prolyl oligopeptidase family serine peptidase n=1 Tax=Jatrophihabitans cynanchi TaxID=2944128 RepID=A0ABY7JXL0_9ACTN|nr:prolyl oligopeptidase family serine peptidase [Jatrophihabitans sp. SB3-54]WAX56430.1 prolyl oligopeptidase family serine peptidase [Jatrophihabitans sp. SB3-54]